jgi:hypothetical protein
MQLQIGDRMTDSTGEWQVVGRPTPAQATRWPAGSFTSPSARVGPQCRGGDANGWLPTSRYGFDSGSDFSASHGSNYSMEPVLIRRCQRSSATVQPFCFTFSQRHVTRGRRPGQTQLADRSPDRRKGAVMRRGNPGPHPASSFTPRGRSRPSAPQRGLDRSRFGDQLSRSRRWDRSPASRRFDQANETVEDEAREPDIIRIREGGLELRN